MKKIVLVLLGLISFTSCTTDDYNNAQEQFVAQENVNSLINTLVEKHQAKNIQQKGTGSLQEVINQLEATALQEPAFLQLVTTNYNTPKAIDIDAIITDGDLALSNLNMRIVAKNYVNTLLNTQTIANLNTLIQTITNDSQLTTAEKTVLLDIIDLQIQHVLGNGDDDKWYKKRILGYLQGATQTKANAVLNAVIIQVLAQQ